MQTISRKKIKSNKKSPEIARFIEFLNQNGMEYADIAESIDTPERTITNYVWKDQPLSGQILRKLLANHGVSIDWIVSGEGSMYLGSNRIGQDRAGYGEVQGENRLINRHAVHDSRHVSDVYGLYAALIEQSLIDAGAEADKDYNYLDLYKLAQAHVLEAERQGDLITTLLVPSEDE